MSETIRKVVKVAGDEFISLVWNADDGTAEATHWRTSVNEETGEPTKALLFVCRVDPTHPMATKIGSTFHPDAAAVWTRDILPAAARK